MPEARLDSGGLDAAFKLRLAVAQCLSSEEPAALLAKLHPELSPSQRREALDRAARLLDSGYGPADRMRDGKLTSAQAVAELKRDNPGFGAASYDAALGWGLFLTR